jgi:catechol 2,3-dioxygenase
MHTAAEESPDTTAGTMLGETTRLGKVRLIVSDLTRSLAFYSRVIGLAILGQTFHSARLGVAQEQRVLLELEQRPGVRPLRERRLGLYHTALLLSSRADLSSFVDHLDALGVRSGMSDHIVSEALYLTDPDGLTIEVYADRFPQDWPWMGEELAVATLPLDLNKLLAVPHSPWVGVPSGSAMGHIHLHIGDIHQARILYHQGLGMGIRTQKVPGALFVAAGSYHHHVGLNTWAGNVPAASETYARLALWELVVSPDQKPQLIEQMMRAGWQRGTDETFMDPWGNALRLIE